MVAVRRLTVVLAGLLALACLVLVARNASAQLDFWYVSGPSIAGLGIALFIGNLGVYAKVQPQAPSGSARGRLSKLFYLFGQASLSIYLWHTFFIDLVLVETYRWGLGSTTKIVLLFATIPVAVGTSILTYRAVEAPMIAFSKSAAWRSRVRLFIGQASAILGNATPRSSRGR
jgi:peptidoglycan/LPS O-acetylase OafA/YrhL